MRRFVNRQRELESLAAWWQDPDAQLALVWGRRRVGKTALAQRFSAELPTIFHTAGARGGAAELRLLGRTAAALRPRRDLERRPLADWDDVFEFLRDDFADREVLLVLDEFPELVRVAPELPGVLRAALERRSDVRPLKVLLCGSAVRTMESLQEERAPLYGRVDLSLQVHAFGPQESGALLDRLAPADRAVVWGLLDGVPLYLQWWDQEASLRRNLERLVCRPDSRLLAEGQLVLATEGEGGELTAAVLHAIAAGRTRHHEIADAIRADPTRTLDRLVSLRLVERLVPVTDDPRRTRRRIYRVADNFLAFWLAHIDPYRGEIERGLGAAILPVLLRRVDEHLGPRWEAAYRSHLRRLAVAGELGPEIVAVGRYWREGSEPVEIDALVLAGRRREIVLAGEAKWSRRLDARRPRRALERRVGALPNVADRLRLSFAAREVVDHAGPDDLVVTASQVFG